VTSAINVAAGTLTVTNVTNGTAGGYAFSDLYKTGNGTLVMAGKLNLDTQGFAGLDVKAGSVMLSTPAMNNQYVSSGGASGVNGNVINQNVDVRSGATLGGAGGVRITGSQPDNVDGTLPHFTVATGGHLAPGNNPSGSNFGAVGTFTLNGGYGNAQTSLAANLQSTSNLDLDIASLASYDNFQLTGGNYNSGQSLAIGTGALVNINALATLQAGTYHIITETPGNNGNFFVITDGGFSIGSAPSGYSYSFADVFTGSDITGVDLIVTASGVPEPASIALLGMGAGLLMLRSRRRSQA
jgi:hypothetical protein